MRPALQLLGRLFNIRRHEWPRFAIIYLTYFIVLTGMQWGRPIVEAAFLTEVGVQFLPWVFVLNGLVTIVSSAIYTAFADRVSNRILLAVLFIASIVGIFLGLLLLQSTAVAVFIPLVLLFLVLNVPLQDLFNVHWPIYVNSFYDTQSAKRIIPILASGARFAGIAAGLTLPYLNRLFQPDPTVGIVFVWLLTLVAGLVLAWFMPTIVRLMRPTASPEASSTFSTQTKSGKDKAAYLDNIREGFRYVTQSTYLRWLAVAAVLTYALLPLINFQSLQILEARFESKEEISNFIATLNVIGNVIALPIQLFLLNRLIEKVGLGNTSLIFPSATLAISGTLILFRTIPAAALGYLNSSVVRTTFRNPIDNLLYNAVPLRIKGRARAFIVGLVVPVGALVGGLLLLTPTISNTDSVLRFILMGLFAVALLGTAFVIRRQYGHALINMLEEEDFSFLLSQIGEARAVADPATLETLKYKLEHSTSPEYTLFMAQLIGQVGGQAAIPILGEAARRADDGRLRASLIDVMTTVAAGGKTARSFYLDFLADRDATVRQAAVVGLEQLIGPGDQTFQSIALSMLYDPDINVRVQILSAVARSGHFYQNAPVVESLNQLLADADPERRARAIEVLGEIGDTRALTYIADYLNDATDPVRLAAALAIEAQAVRSLPAKLQRSIVDQACVLLTDPVERVRQIALNLLGRLGDQDAYAEMVPVLADPSLEIRTAAADALVQARRAAIPLVHPQLDGADPKLRKMASFVLSRIDPEKYGPLIYAHITSSLLTIYQNVGQIAALADLTRFSSISVLQSSLREQIDQLIEEIFYLLTALHPREDVMLVAESLQNESARVRANAAEALESLTSPQLADLIVPLFHPNRDVGQLIALSETTWDMKPPGAAEAIKQLLATPEISIVRAIATFTLGEMGATFSDSANGADQPALPAEPPTEDDASSTSNPDPMAVVAKPSTQTPEEAIPADEGDDPIPKRRRRRSRPNPADLLGALADEPGSGKPVAASEEPSKSRRRHRSPDDILGALAGIGGSRSTAEPVPDLPLSVARPNVPFTLSEIEAMIDEAFRDAHIDVRLAARAAKRTIKGVYITDIQGEEVYLLSTIEKVIFLKEVPFFQGMTVYQLEVLANICEEKLYREDERIFEQNDAGGALFVIVNGQVGIEQERRRGSFARVATLGPRAYFGETSLFDNSPRSSAAIALQDTLALRLRREPLIALARQYPDLSLELITVLSQRLRDAQSRIAELTRSRPRELQKLFDKLE